MLTESDRELLDLRAFAKLATQAPNGALQNTVMWYRRESDTLRMITPAASAKARNLARNPRVAIVIDHPDNSYDYVEWRGRAEIVRDDAAARAELRLVAHRYIGDRANDFVDALSADERVLIVTYPVRVRRYGGARQAFDIA